MIERECASNRGYHCHNQRARWLSGSGYVPWPSIPNRCDASLLEILCPFSSYAQVKYSISKRLLKRDILLVHMWDSISRMLWEMCTCQIRRSMMILHAYVNIFNLNLVAWIFMTMALTLLAGAPTNISILDLATLVSFPKFKCKLHTYKQAAFLYTSDTTTQTYRALVDGGDMSCQPDSRWQILLSMKVEYRQCSISLVHC